MIVVILLNYLKVLIKKRISNAFIFEIRDPTTTSVSNTIGVCFLGDEIEGKQARC